MQITYKRENAKIKNIYIKIVDGQVVVRCPATTSKKYIEELIEKKSSWIEQRIKAYKENEENNLSNIELLGKKYETKIGYKDIQKVEINVNNNVEIFFPTEFKNREISKQMKNKIIDAIYKKVAYTETQLAMDKYTQITGVTPKQWRIRNIKTAWGTCSSNKNITISSNLAKYDRQTFEYVVLHELSHLKYMNHSKAFWQMVECHMPNYKEIRKQLK